ARDEVARLVLTASGGPFRGGSAAELAGGTREQALAHPTWDMGPVVTINSATLVNKGLELIEAHLLFDVPYADIDVVGHRQSIVHPLFTSDAAPTTAHPPPPAGPAAAHRTGAGLARPAARRPAGAGLVDREPLGVHAAGRDGVPGG